MQEEEEEEEEEEVEERRGSKIHLRICFGSPSPPVVAGETGDSVCLSVSFLSIYLAMFLSVTIMQTSNWLKRATERLRSRALLVYDRMPRILTYT